MLDAFLILIAIVVIFVVFVPSKPTDRSEDEIELYSDDEYTCFLKLSDDEIKSISNMLIGRAKREGSASLRDICNDHYGINFYRSWQFSRIGHYINSNTFKMDKDPLDNYKIIVIFEDNERRIGTVLNAIISIN